MHDNNVKKSKMLSYNKINLYNICPRAYMYSHEWNLQTLRIGGMEFGRNIHKIIEIIIANLLMNIKNNFIIYNKVVSICKLYYYF